MWVQEGLQNMGFYNGAIDGSFGQGSRNAVRSYQTAIGVPATGRMSGAEINDLVALSPAFVTYAPNDTHLFNTDLARDLDRDGVRELQALLNTQGFNAGPIDGAWGGKTREAVRSYKAVNRLPGPPLPTRRLLAHLRGSPAPLPAGLQFAALKYEGSPTSPGGTVTAEGQSTQAGFGQVAPVQTAAAEPSGQASLGAGSISIPAVSTKTPAAEITFDLLGLKLGMSDDEAQAALTRELGSDVISASASADAFGGNAVLSQAGLAVQSAWPAPAAEQMLTLYSSAQPELGLIAAFRLIKMPDGVDQSMFEAQVLPEIVSYYGELGRVGDAPLWIGKSEMAGEPAACGALALAQIANAPTALDALWSSGGGVMLDAASLDSATAACGNVLSVSYEGGIIRIALWNSDALSTGGVMIPQIKF
jgi:peptidoglycan hydrolase-like protein with peptidoglycan-binding domain